MREIILLFIVVVAASFVGAAAGSYAMRVKDAREMAELRHEYQPAVCKLFSGSYQP